MNPAPISSPNLAGNSGKRLAAPPKQARLPSLDGWRALSILLVLATHSHYVAHYPSALDQIFYRFLSGELGVRCFFIISGFLITWLMMIERAAAGRVSLQHFYIRRALRILPVYFTFLGVLGCLSLFTPFTQTRASWIGNLTFTTNFIGESWTSGHLWSLAVEEQFYLVWPVLFVLLGMAKNPRAALVILSLPLFIAPIWRVMTYKQLYPPSLSHLFTLASFFNYFDCLAAGCICAFLLWRWRSRLETALGAWPKGVAAVGLAFILMPLFSNRLHLPGRVMVASIPTLQTIGFSLLLLQSVIQPQLTCYRLLNWKWVCHLGVLSYSIYIWQQIFCTSPAVFGLAPVWWLSFPGWLVPTLAVAHLSYYCLERPFFQLRSHFR